jgi:hypothetical protein
MRRNKTYINEGGLDSVSTKVQNSYACSLYLKHFILRNCSLSKLNKTTFIF